MGSNPPVPEILPPNPGMPDHGYGPVPPPPRPRRRWAIAPATYILLGINCAVFALSIFKGINPFSPGWEDLRRLGADNAGAVLYAGQWWRIVTAMFVHGGFLHLALNMWCLWNLGMLAEPLMGSFGVLTAYILTGAAGNLLSTLVNWYKYASPEGAATGWFGPASVGASGAVFGLAGALIMLLKSTRLPVPPEELKKLRRSVIYFAAINLIIGFSINAGTSAVGAGGGVDNMAHVGGFACGLLFAAPMIPRIGSSRQTFDLRLRVAVGMVTGILVLFAYFLSVISRH